MDITKFVSKSKISREESQIKKFEKLIVSASSKEEQRKIEMHLLKPMPVPKYKGAKAGRTSFQKRTLLLAFPDSSHIEKLGKFFKLNAYVENNTYDVDFLIELIRLMRNGRIKWSRSRKKFLIKNKNGKMVRL